MKRLLLVFPLLLVLASSRASADIVDDIIALAQKNLSADVIIAFIDHNAEALRDLKAADIGRMMDAKVPDRVVEAVLRRQYAMPPDGASQASPPQASTPREPQTAQTEETARPPESEDNVTYIVDTSYPVPIFYEPPLFAFGMDLFGFPHLHHHFGSFHHNGDSFSFKHQPAHFYLDGHKAKPPHYGWTSAEPPVAQSPMPRPGTAQPGRPVTANSAPPPTKIRTPAQDRPALEHSTPAPERHAPTQVAPASAQAPAAQQTHSFVRTYSGESYSREAIGREGREVHR